MRRNYASTVASLAICVVLGVTSMSPAQQIADESFKPKIENPAYPQGTGPMVMVDEAHFNFHTADGRYQSFAEVLRQDGYVVKASLSPFTRESLKDAQILVIANALSERNRDDWSLPTPSAFSDEEIAAVSDWVKDGGSLFLVADHMPFPGCAEKLGAAFGFRFNNGYAIRTQDGKRIGGLLTFSRSDGSLANHAITQGRTTAERVDSVISFTGQAFQSDVDVQPLLTVGASVVSFMPTVAGQITDATHQVPVEGWLQGAVLRSGSGRAAIFGEAAMFTAQLSVSGSPMGMNAPGAEQNVQFLLNVMHWLSGLLDDVVAMKPSGKLVTTWGSAKCGGC